MSMPRVRVAIAGGGPAGSSAAVTLARSGIETCLVDRSLFPRDKLCGGLLTLRSRQIFRQIFNTDWRPVIQAESKGVHFFYKHRWLRSVSNYKEMFFTARRDYDAFLLELARQSGVTVLEGKAVKEVDLTQSQLRLQEGACLPFDFLIGADGVNSLVAKSIFGKSLHPAGMGLGLEMEIPCSREVMSIQDPEIYFGLLGWGYGWVFPKRDALTVGVGGLLKANPGMKNCFQEFLRLRFGRLPPGKIKGHFIPFGGFSTHPGKGKVLLCGDAAGLVEPITGEGIAFAMLSGFHAAESIKEALSSGCPGSASILYEGRYREITNAFRQANWLRRCLLPRSCQYVFSRVVSRSESLPRRYLDLMAGEMTYGEYGRFLLKKASLGVFDWFS